MWKFANKFIPGIKICLSHHCILTPWYNSLPKIASLLNIKLKHNEFLLNSEKNHTPLGKTMVLTTSFIFIKIGLLQDIVNRFLK